MSEEWEDWVSVEHGLPPGDANACFRGFYQSMVVLISDGEYVVPGFFCRHDGEERATAVRVDGAGKTKLAYHPPTHWMFVPPPPKK